MSDRIKKTIEIDITGDVNKTLQDVEKSTKAADTATKGLKQQYREVIKELQSGKLTGKEFDEATRRAGALKDQIGDINTRVNNLASDTRKLDAFLDIGSGIAGGFAAAQGAAALFGGENEKLQETLLKVQGSLAVLNGIQAVSKTLNKDSAASTVLAGVAQKAYAFAVGISTAALKKFGIALTATGIGAIVVGIGLLIANFEKVSEWVTNITDKFGGWRQVLMFVAPPIWGIIKALEALGIIDDKATKDLKKNAEEKIKADQKQLEELGKKRKKTEDYYDFEIAKAKAAGKNTEEIEKLKRDALLKSLFLENQVQRARIQSGQASQDEIKAWNERQAEIIKLQQEAELAEIQSQTKKENELKKIREKAAADRERAAEKEKENEKKRQDDIKNLRKGFEIELENLNADTDEKKLELEKKRKEKELELLKATEEEKAEFIKLYSKKENDLLLKKQEEAEKITKEFQDKLKDMEDKNIVDKLNRDIENINKDEENKIIELEKLNATEEQKQQIRDFYNLLRQEKQGVFNEDIKSREEELNERLIEIENVYQQAKNNALNTGLNILQEFAGKNKAISIGILAVQKGLAIADVVTNASKSIAGQISGYALADAQALAQLGPIAGAPFVKKNKLLLAKGIKTTKIGAATSIASILSQTIGSLSGSIGGGAGGGSADGGGSAAGAGGQPVFNIVGQSSTNQLADTIGRQQQEPVKAFVVSSEVTTAQSLDRNRVNNSTFL